MTKKKTTPRKKSVRTKADGVLTGHMSPAPAGMHCVWFDLDRKGKPDHDSILVEPVACLVSYHHEGAVRVGGMIFGTGGLYLAEMEDDNYRGYTVLVGNETTADAAVSFVSDWEADVFGEDEDEDEDEEDEDDENDEDDEDDEDE